MAQALGALAAARHHAERIKEENGPVVDPLLPAPEKVGVGLVFKQDEQGRNFVHNVIPGGSAEADGRVRVGDILHRVGGTVVERERLSSLKNFVCGAGGSTVVLHLVRLGAGGEVSPVEVELRRAVTDPASVPTDTAELEATVRRLRDQAQEEGRLREREESLRSQLEAELASERRRRQEVEADIAKVSEELVRAQQEARLCLQTLEHEQQAVSTAKEELEEKLFVADTNRTVMELELKRLQREGCCGPFFAT